MTTPQTPLGELKQLCELPDVHGRTLSVAKFCRDKLGWAVHPLYGPNSGNEKARGKAPVHKGWPSHTPEQATDEYLHEHFGNGHDYNLGVVVRGNHVCVDLDSKADKGQSVDEWTEKHPELAKVPRERTAGGQHLHFKCRNLPAFTKNGKPYTHALVRKLNDQVTAELYFNGLNIVTAPSIHASGVTYTWEVVGEIPEVSWEQLTQWFGFELPDAPATQLAEVAKRPRIKNSDEWWHKYSGDFRTLDLTALFKSSGHLGEKVAEGRFAVHCPWREEHSDGSQAWKKNDSSTIIFSVLGQNKFPGFHCSHAHCQERGLKDVLEWFEHRTPGIVDQNCARQWIWHDGQASQDGRPRLVLSGLDRPVSQFAAEAGALLRPKNEWFLKSDQVVNVRLIELNEKVKYKAFVSIKPAEVCSAFEQYVETGILHRKGDEEHFVPKTMDMQLANILILAPQFKNRLPKITRILDVQIPVLYKGEVVFPDKGYDERFSTYCDPGAPDIVLMTLEEAICWIQEAHPGFCWQDKQDLVHALARFITPFAHGLMGWDARFPLWYFEANKQRAGKDYLAGVTMITYEGHTCEDAPLSTKGSEETRKRITTAIMHGRRRMHFANCQGYLDSPDLQQAVTSCVWADRILGGNTEVRQPNEIEFSLSANLGLTYRSDFEPRMRKIRLFYPQEDANSRTFPKPNLHHFVLENRRKLLSAVATLYMHWQKKGCPSGRTPFTSFPQWARVVGGVMFACGLGDPCLPHQEEADIGGDQLTRALKEVFQICYEDKPEAWLEKKEIYHLIQQKQEECESLGFFGDLSEGSKDQRGATTKLGIQLSKAVGTELGGIRLERMSSGSSARTDRAKFRFVKPQTPSEDHGREISSTVFGAPKSPSRSSSNVDLGDVGDLYNSVNGENEKCVRGGKEEKQENVSAAITGGCESRQGRQGLHPGAAVPTLLTTLDDLQTIASAIRETGGPVVLDIETRGPKAEDALNPFKGEIRLLTLAAGEHRPWLLDLKAIGYDLGSLKSVLEESEIIGHHLGFDALWLKVKCGVSLNRVFCTLTASRLLTAGTDHDNDLGECLRRYLQVDLPKDLGKSDWGTTALSPEQLRYAANDVLYLGKLKAALVAEIDKNGLERVCALEQSLLPVVVAMEARGTAVDPEKLASIREKAKKEEQDARTAAQKFVGDTGFNPNSVQQVLVKFKQRGVTLRDTKEETLIGCTDQLAAEILKYRTATKKAEQAQSLLDSMGVDGRIHASFNPLGTKTGRFSSSKPNLQNVGRGELRECFIAGPGNVLVVADYSQIELRAAAAIADDKEMLRAYNEHADLHMRTASLIKGKAEAAIEMGDRQLAKAVNFGLLYGQSAQGLVKYAKASYRVELTGQEATRFRARFFYSYKGLSYWHEEARNRAHQNVEEIRTRTGRRQLLPQGPKNWWSRFAGLLNTVVQGSCADGLKMAMVELSKRLPPDAGIVSAVHDELIVEVPESKSEEVKQLVEQCMVERMKELFPEVPIEVDVKICKNWGEK